MGKINHVFLIIVGLLFSYSSSSMVVVTEHPLLTVNPFWEQQAPEFLDEDVLFPTDRTELILTHLSLVERILTEKPIDHLNPKQQENRARLLNELKIYWQNGIIPTSNTPKNPKPFFKGTNETMCAVGHLLVQDQAIDLVKNIIQNQNRGYIQEMDQTILTKWAEKNGMELEELKWIQPSNYQVREKYVSNAWIENKTLPDCGKSNGSLSIDFQLNLSEVACRLDFQDESLGYDFSGCDYPLIDIYGVISWYKDTEYLGSGFSLENIDAGVYRAEIQLLSTDSILNEMVSDIVLNKYAFAIGNSEEENFLNYESYGCRWNTNSGLATIQARIKDSLKNHWWYKNGELMETQNEKLIYHIPWFYSSTDNYSVLIELKNDCFISQAINNNGDEIWPYMPVCTLPILTEVINASCGEHNGSIKLNPSRIIDDEYEWDDFEKVHERTKLSPGTYSIEYKNYNGCWENQDIIVYEDCFPDNCPQSTLGYWSSYSFDDKCIWTNQFGQSYLIEAVPEFLHGKWKTDQNHWIQLELETAGLPKKKFNNEWYQMAKIECYETVETCLVENLAYGQYSNEEEDYVCGCDGNNYLNSDAALSAGISAWSEGSCLEEENNCEYELETYLKVSVKQPYNSELTPYLLLVEGRPIGAADLLNDEFVFTTSWFKNSKGQILQKSYLNSIYVKFLDLDGEIIKESIEFCYAYYDLINHCGKTVCKTFQTDSFWNDPDVNVVENWGSRNLEVLCGKNGKKYFSYQEAFFDGVYEFEEQSTCIDSEFELLENDFLSYDYDFDLDWRNILKFNSEDLVANDELEDFEIPIQTQTSFQGNKFYYNSIKDQFIFELKYCALHFQDTVEYYLKKENQLYRGMVYLTIQYSDSEKYVVDLDVNCQLDSYSINLNVKGGYGPFLVSNLLNETDTVVEKGLHNFAAVVLSNQKIGDGFSIEVLDQATGIRETFFRKSVSCLDSPINLLSFSANTNDQGNELKWEIASAKYGDQLSLEYSTDGLNFQPIYQEEFDELFLDSRSQSYLHHNGQFSASNFYRVKIKPFGYNNNLYSKIISLDLMSPQENDWAKLEGLRLNWSDLSISQLSVFNAQGQVFFMEKVENKNSFDLSKIDLPSGIYFIQLHNSIEATTIKWANF